MWRSSLARTATRGRPYPAGCLPCPVGTTTGQGPTLTGRLHPSFAAVLRIMRPGSTGTSPSCVGAGIGENFCSAVADAP
mgnify:CR=1 FL=1